MSDVRRLLKLKENVGNLRRDIDKNQGALDQLLTQIKEEFDCKNIDEARELLDDLRKQEKKLGAEFDDALETFEKKWSELLK